MDNNNSRSLTKIKKMYHRKNVHGSKLFNRRFELVSKRSLEDRPVLTDITNQPPFNDPFINKVKHVKVGKTIGKENMVPSNANVLSVSPSKVSLNANDTMDRKLNKEPIAYDFVAPATYDDPNCRTPKRSSEKTLPMFSSNVPSFPSHCPASTALSHSPHLNPVAENKSIIHQESDSLLNPFLEPTMYAQSVDLSNVSSGEFYINPQDVLDFFNDSSSTEGGKKEECEDDFLSSKNGKLCLPFEKNHQPNDSLDICPNKSPCLLLFSSSSPPPFDSSSGSLDSPMRSLVLLSQSDHIS